MESEILPKGDLKNIIDNPTLKWIFVGGKGGVGKTSVSCSLAVLLSQLREKILIISTDPAHNLSDAFNQKMGSQPTLINGFQNLFGLEINPKEIKDEDADPLGEVFGLQLDDDSKNILEDVKNSIPGVDEALAIGLLLQDIDKMQYSLVIFDTAPTGHTLRLLNFPNVLENSFGKLNTLKEKLGPMSSLLSTAFGEGFKNLTELITIFQTQIEKIRKDFTDINHTTFIAVCIPEFLSLYETEKLIQELNKVKVDCHNIVINQVLFVNKENENCDCDMCKSRFNMQSKYIKEIIELYGGEDNEEEDQKNDDVNMNIINDENENNKKFNISILPLQEEEIRGVDLLKKLGKYLI